MEPKYPILQAAIGAVLGFVIVIILEILLFIILSEIFHARVTPRGLAWIILPIGGAVMGWNFGKHFGAEALTKIIESKANLTDVTNRKIIAFSVLWTLAVIGFHTIFNPYGYYWSSDEWFQFWMTLFAPIGLAVVGVKLLGWANKNSDGNK